MRGCGGGDAGHIRHIGQEKSGEAIEWKLQWKLEKLREAA